MALLSYQHALTRLVQLPFQQRQKLLDNIIEDAENHHSELTQQERLSLFTVSQSKGAQVSHDVQRWWRNNRLLASSPLTIEFLKQLERLEVIEEYLDSVLCQSLFFYHEYLAFHHFIQSYLDLPNDCKAINLLEKSLKWIKLYQHQRHAAPQHQAQGSTKGGLRLSNFSNFIQFDSAPELLIAKLCHLTVDTETTLSGKFNVVTGSQLPKGWRNVTDAEANILQTLTLSTTEFNGWTSQDFAECANLIEEGILEVV